WENHIFDVEPYELNYLADFVELQELKTDLKEVSGLGRNCMMFDNVRKWAYKAIRAHRGSTFDIWLGKVLEQCQNANGAFIEPLPYSEVKATAKSVSRWVWRNHGKAYAKFIERQTVKGRMGGLVSDSSHGGKARSAKYSDLRQQALVLRVQGYSYTEIAKTLNIGRRTAINWCNQVVQVQA
ncbi:primase C-terminal domain-containing protein, partial [Acinetobacter ursingii]